MEQNIDLFCRTERGGKIADDAWKALETQIGKNIVTSLNVMTALKGKDSLKQIRKEKITKRVENLPITAVWQYGGIRLNLKMVLYLKN